MAAATTGLMTLMSEKPVILISSCHDAQSTGDAAANGGLKVYNNFANLLIAHGYEAYVVTWTGEPIRWLIHHAPYASIEQARRWKTEGRNIIWVTGWIWAKSYLDLADQFCFYDHELAFTSSYQLQRGLLEQYFHDQRIAKVACNSRTMQAYYGATYGFMPDYIPEWHSEAFVADPDQRVPGRIGYFDEGAHTQHDIEVIRTACENAGFQPEFMQISGNEAEVLAKLQTVDIQVALNVGKSDLFGEGCPRSPAESMRTGAVLIAYEVYGNAYYLVHGYTGFVVERRRPDLMAKRVIQLLQDSELRDTMRRRSYEFSQNAMGEQGRFELVAKFLDLEV